jgi:beta-glucosidase
LGLQSYRFSISWPRILPDGRGLVNQAGLDFYSRLVDGLLEAGIAPNATLYHWDLPQALQDAGGWPERGIVDAFVEYADVVTRHLGDRVPMWATFNEPWVIAILGYEIGIHEPGHHSQADAVRAAHHLLLAHGRSLPIIRANSPAADVGIVLNLGPQVPASNSPADIKAARLSDGTLNRWFLDPLAGFGYPNDVAAHYGDALDVVQPGDMEAMAAPIDFLGVNYYMRGIVRAPDEPDNAPQTVFVGDEKTDMDWEVYPQGLSDMLLRLHTAYRFPALYVTENGAAYKDQVAEDGAIHDEERISYYRRHLLEAARAIALGVPLRGYFAWSLMDNFEWAYGLSKRFGLVYVDFDTQARILKDSAYWYGDVIASNEVS